MSGIGGVETQFEIFLQAVEEGDAKNVHRVYTTTKVNPLFSKSTRCARNIFSNTLNLAVLHRQNTVFHSYNNLINPKAALFFRTLKPRYLLFHEHGACWDVTSKNSTVIENAKQACIILCNSHATKHLLAKKFDIPNDKLLVIYNGVFDNHAINFCATNKKTKSDKICVGYIGRLETNKGVHTLIQAMDFIPKSIAKDIEVRIVGNGSGKSILQTLAQKYPNVVFTGSAANPFKAISEFDLLIVPSIREPFGNVIVEAALCRVPVIAACTDGIAEIITHNENGTLLQPQEEVDQRYLSPDVPLPEYVIAPKTFALIKPKQLAPNDIAQNIMDFLEHPKRYQNYADKLYKSVIDRFHVDQYIQNLNNIYTSLAND